MTKQILCTLGPASLNRQTIQRLTELQVALFRINLSHTAVDQIEELVNLVRAYSEVPICLDTQGAQVRTGVFGSSTQSLTTGQIMELVAAPAIGDESKIPLYPPQVVGQLQVGDLITLDTAALPIQVVQADGQCFGRVASGGTVGSNKAVSVDRTISLDSMTPSDKAAVELGLKLGIEHFALSFSNRPSDVRYLRDMVGPNPHIIAKVESHLGLQNLDGILKEADAILIDRGDLSREVAIERLPFVQKEIIRQANLANVPVNVATNLLESMVANPQPTRAEVNDVINTLIDGADGRGLAAETAIGQYPVQCVNMVRSLIQQFESRTNRPGFVDLERIPHSLTPPHGNLLVQRIIADPDPQELGNLQRLEVDQYVMMDAVQIAIGTFSPLNGFMGREELEGVLKNNRLLDETAWPMPILLQLPGSDDGSYTVGETLALTYGGTIQALLKVEDSFSYELESLSQQWFGTTDSSHPGVCRLKMGGNRFIGGKVDLLSHSMYPRGHNELTPAQARYIFEHRQWQKVLGFHTRNVPHRAHEYIQLTGLTENDCDGMFIHPVIGPKKTGDFSGDIILKSYQLLIDQSYAPGQALLGGFVTYSRYAGPREAVFTAICRQNFGCSHFIVGRDHTGVGDFYHPDASKQLFEEIGDLSIKPVYFNEVYYCQACGSHVERCKHNRDSSEQISGTWGRNLLKQGQMPPDWYMREPVSALNLEALQNGSEVFSD